MILNSKLEVRKCHCDKGCDNDEDNEHNKEDAVDGVYLMPPDTGKYVVQLDVNCAEREEPCHCHLRNSASVPWKLRDFPWVLGCAAGGLEFCVTIFPGYTTQHKERRGYKCPDEDNDNDSAERQSCCSTVRYCNCI